MSIQPKLKKFDETYSGWGTETRNGSVAGLEGYSKERAEEVAIEVRAQMAITRGIISVDVNVVPMSNGNFKVVNTSTYESYF